MKVKHFTTESAALHFVDELEGQEVIDIDFRERADGFYVAYPESVAV